MPYRRLPNTDAARVRALSKIIEFGTKYDVRLLAFKEATFSKIKAFMPIFEQARMMQKEAKDRQVSNSKDYTEAYKKAKIYISHFLQVLNMAIARGEIKPSARKYYGLDEKSGRIPELTTEKEVIEWGEKAIKGENDRIVKMGTPLLCPKIAVVKVYYDQFVEKLNFQKMLQSISTRANSKVSSLRPACDKLITQAWNEIEEYYANETPERKREQCSKYGVTYVMRPYEKAKEELRYGFAS
jgi:hypothetical protein